MSFGSVFLTGKSGFFGFSGFSAMLIAINVLCDRDHLVFDFVLTSS